MEVNKIQSKKPKAVFVKEGHYYKEWPDSSPWTDSRGFRYIGHRDILYIGKKEIFIQDQDGASATGSCWAGIVLEELQKAGIIDYNYIKTELDFPERLDKKLQIPIPKKEKTGKLEAILVDFPREEALYINRKLELTINPMIKAQDALERLTNYGVVKILSKKIIYDDIYKSRVVNEVVER